MDGNIDLVTEHRFFDLFDEEPLAADHRQRHIEDLVADRLDLGQGDFHLRITLVEFGLNPVGLPESELTGAGTDTQEFSCHLLIVLLYAGNNLKHRRSG